MFVFFEFGEGIYKIFIFIYLVFEEKDWDFIWLKKNRFCFWKNELDIFEVEKCIIKYLRYCGWFKGFLIEIKWDLIKMIFMI